MSDGNRAGLVASRYAGIRPAMTGTNHQQVRAELAALGWQCHETEADGQWTVHVMKGERSIVSSGCDRELIWRAVFQDALRSSP